MQNLVLFLGLLTSAAPAVTYKCKDAHGNWTAQACLIAVPMEETAYMRWQRERQAIVAARAAARQRLGPYCFRLDPKGSFYDCVEAQLKYFDEIRRIAGSLPLDSVPRLRLADCVTRSVDAATGATDYSHALECYRRQ